MEWDGMGRDWMGWDGRRGEERINRRDGMGSDRIG